MLCKAALEIEQGIFEADLDGGVCKKNIAVPG
ncbi:MAG: type II toxin-antitoxin system RelE/ParE family toxin [Acidovorax temperans]